MKLHRLRECENSIYADIFVEANRKASPSKLLFTIAVTTLQLIPRRIAFP